MQRKWVIPVASAIPILAIVYAFSLGPSPHKVLLDFKTRQVPESALMDPLLDADAQEIAPLLITEIVDRTMTRRRYAIAYLGKIKNRSAITTLENILADGTERDYFRADALQAIRSIDVERAKQRARLYRTSPNEVGRIARELLAEVPAVVGALH